MTGFLQRLVGGAGLRRARLRPLAGPPDGSVARDLPEPVEERIVTRPTASAAPATAAPGFPMPRVEPRQRVEDAPPAPTDPSPFATEHRAATAAEAAIRAAFVPLVPATARREADAAPTTAVRPIASPQPVDTALRAEAAPDARDRGVPTPATASAALRAVVAPAASGPGAAGARGATRDVEIRIGRIEVVAVPEVRQAPAAPPAPRRAPSLDDYLKSRAGGGR